MESAEQPAQDLYKKVSGSLNQAGHPVTSAEVNPDDLSPLEDIRDRLRKAAGHAAGSVSGEEGPLTHVETAPAQKGLSVLWRRLIHKK